MVNQRAVSWEQLRRVSRLPVGEDVTVTTTASNSTQSTSIPPAPEGVSGTVCDLGVAALLAEAHFLLLCCV